MAEFDPEPVETSLVYWEPQEAAFCAVHAINNLLQFRCIDEWQLSQIAQRLTEDERRLMAESGVESEDFLRFMASDSQHVDESGNFSVEVIRAALENFGLQMVPIGAEGMEKALADPLSQRGFICNLKAHWFAVRKLQTPDGEVWFNLDSTLDPQGPRIIGQFHLDAFLQQLQLEGYSIFVIAGVWPKQVGSPREGRSPEGSGSWFSLERIRELAKMPARSPRRGRGRGNANKRRSPELTEEEMLRQALEESLQQQRPRQMEVEAEDEELLAALRLSLGQDQPPQEVPPPPPALPEEEFDDDDEDLKAALAMSLADHQTS